MSFWQYIKKKKTINKIVILSTVDPISKEIGNKEIKYIFFYSIDVKLAKFKGKFIIYYYLTLILIAWNQKLYIFNLY